MIVRVTIFLAVLILTTEAKKYGAQREQWQEFEEFLKWKQWRAEQENGRENRLLRESVSTEEENYDVGNVYEKQRQNPPPIDRTALMARYIVNQADWVPVATISTRKGLESFPVVNLVSFSDGPLGNGTGVPYLFLTPLDYTAQDLAKDQRASVMMSLAQGNYCKEKAWDPMDPRCARVLLSGKIKAVKNESAEHEVAKNAVFQRHPKLVNMPANHHFYFAKLKISTIVVLDTFGGPKHVNVKDYFHPTANFAEEFEKLFSAEEDSSQSQEEYKPTNYFNPIVRAV